jgi:hypothetical protein
MIMLKPITLDFEADTMQIAVFAPRPHPQRRERYEQNALLPGL